MQPNISFFNQRICLIKAQPELDVDPIPAPEADGYRLFDSKSAVADDVVELPYDKSFLGADDFVKANTRGTVEGDFEVYPPANPGTDEAYCGRILLPAGWGVTLDAAGKITRYSPVSEDIPLVAIRNNHAGVYMNLLNARGTVSALTMEIGKRVTGHVQLQGDYDTITGQPFPRGIVLPAVDSYVLSENNSACLISSELDAATPTGAAPLADLHVWAKSLVVDTGQSLQKEAYTEHAENNFDGRKGSFTLVMAKTDIDNDFNPFWCKDKGVMLNLRFYAYRKNGVAGLYSMLYTRGKIESVEATDTQGKYTWTIKGRCLGTEANGGGDQYGLEFGDAAAQG
jgi:hypothetical protein